MPYLHLAVALDGAGWHPAAWREPDARPRELFTARYWTDLAAEAERGLLDFVTIEDSLALQSDHPTAPEDRTDRVRGRLDALLVAARIAPTTRHLGFVPTVVVTHTEPFHTAKAVATLDYVSTGRAGVRVQVSARPDEAAHVGRREVGEPTDLVEEAADYVEVLRRLWDSWEDDAEIRDVATGRFIDRAKLHHIDFTGRYFSVKGPSITPRPPQGQPIVSATEPIQGIDIRYAPLLSTVDTPGTFGDLVVFLDDEPGVAADRLARLDELAGGPYTSDVYVFAGTPAELADLLTTGQRAGLAGFRLRPGALPHDLVAISRALVPELQRRGIYRSAYEAGTLRGLLGLPRPANRYAAA